MKFKLFVWNFIVFISIVTILVLANLSWPAVVVGGLAYTTIMFALAHVYERAWTAAIANKSATDTTVANQDTVLSDVSLPTWTYYDLVAAMVLGAATGWIIEESSK